MKSLLTSTSEEQRNALLAAAMDVISAGIVMTDPRQPGNPVIFVNKAFTNITGYAPEEAIGRNCSFLQGIHTDRYTAAEIKDAIRARKGVNVEILNYRKDGTPFWNHLRINPIFDEQGELLHYIGLQNDITLVHATQQALQVAKEQAERATNVKSHFLAMMSHEIRTPINGILGMLSLLQDTRLDAEQSRLTKAALESCDALLGIVNDILDFSKIEAGKLDIETTDFDLSELTDGVITLIHPRTENKKIALALTRHADVPRQVVGDPMRLRQILLNLLSNAVKFTEQGSVTVTISHLMTYEDQGQRQSLVRFEVLDTGPGIAPDGQQRLFTEFNQLDASVARKHGGTGLGLAICRRLVHLMNGEIGVESRVGEGSKFWFVLPFALPEAPPAAQTETTSDTPPAPSLRQGKILVVEDNPVNQMVTAAFLEKDGHKVVLAENGLIAVNKVQENRYDLVLMDISMPEMDGMTATRHIRQLGGAYATLPIIAMTALSMPGDRERCLAAGMNDYLAKPVKQDLLRSTLKKWLAPGQEETGGSPPTDKADTKPVPEDTPALFDRSVLDQMLEEIGDKDMIANLMSIFAQDMDRRIAALVEAARQERWDDLRDEAHALKSSSASCGLMAFSALMRSIELALRAGNKEEAQSLLPQVEDLTRRSRDALRKGEALYR